jgi:ATP-dependent DNA helicase RecQ
MFWLPDEPLQLDVEGKRLRYRYPTQDGGRTLTFVGFQEPIQEIPRGTLLRVSLAHRWRPQERPDDELRCFVQLSGWFLNSKRAVQNEGPAPTKIAGASHLNTTAHQPKALELDYARETLKRTFGFPDFLPLQAEVIARVLAGHDSLVVMPTGGGKSLCYQLPALLLDGLTVVVSPLVALMQDQVRQLRQLDIPAACLNHTVSHPEYLQFTNRIRRGEIRLVYVAPETLLRPETVLLLEQSRLSCLAIDEAHCISEWGHDFRPEYRQLGRVRERFPRAACLLLTATATARVREDIRKQLKIPSQGEFVASFNRQNLLLTVKPREDDLAQIVGFLRAHPDQAGIIYCGTRKQADQLCAALQANGYPALPYHAGLEDKVRHENQERFTSDDVPLMVATVAFGMGINKPNIRFVIHAHLPKDLESYYQEIGRAGRDGLPADCLLLYSRRDVVVHGHFTNQGAKSERAGRRQRLDALVRFAEARDCRRTLLLAYFGETFAGPCSHCDNCLTQTNRDKTAIDVTPSAHKFLSLVRETGQLFGPTYLISILRGSKSAVLLQRGHESLHLYGCGKEHSTDVWRKLARQFMDLDLVEQDLQFGSMRLTAEGRSVLEFAKKVFVPSETAAAEVPRRSELGPQDLALFERLRQLRRRLATEAGVPPFMIFSDRTLTEMATRLPRTEDQFLSVNGVGEAKLARYGEAFLTLIREYVPGDKTPATPEPAPATETLIRPQTGRRYQEIGALFAAGNSVDSIASRFNIMLGTVISHLETYVQSGAQLDAERILELSGLNAPDRSLALAAFERLGLERLAPVHGALSGAISYEELRILRLFLRCGGSSGRAHTAELSSTCRSMQQHR